MYLVLMPASDIHACVACMQCTKQDVEIVMLYIGYIQTFIGSKNRFIWTQEPGADSGGGGGVFGV